MAATLAEAEALVATTTYDVVILDLSLRENDGVELLRSLTDGRASPCLVFISGFDERVRAAAARLAGALGLFVAGTLGKPLVLDDLKALLTDLPPRPPRRDPFAFASIDVAELAEAIAQNQLTVLYQPKVRLADRHIIGVEALVRWHSSNLGTVSPAVFIPIAEQAGLIESLTRNVMAGALAALHEWRKFAPGLTMAVNLSPLSLSDLGLPERVSAALATAGLPPESLVLEVTEGAVMADYVTAADILTRLRIRGIKVAIDDFGTGHSSLLSLLRLPFSELKIDQNFVRVLGRDPEAKSIIRAVIRLGQELGLDLVAEGVETETQAASIAALGCATGQGYLFGRPMSATALALRLRAPALPMV